MAVYCAASSAAQAASLSVPGAQACRKPRSIDRHSLCAQDEYRLGVSAPGNGMRFRHDLLATAGGMAEVGRVGPRAPGAAGEAASGREDRLVAGRGGFFERTRGFGGEKTGPNPTDRS